MTSGRILHTQRLSTEDGPGLRTTVFFKGCPLHCDWCHNPESISSRCDTQWFSARCLGCETCLKACPNGCLTRTSDGLHIDRVNCQACGTCAEACPSGALELLGREVDTDELLSELVKDRVYYEKSGGGVTLSGGEPTFQPEFALSLLKGLKERGIATALDTCGQTTSQVLERMLPYTDLVLFDLKIWDAVLHTEHTGQTNERIFQNLLFLKESILNSGSKTQMWIRTPLIPGATTQADNLKGIGSYLGTHLDGMVARWELCAFNNLSREQYRRLGLEWKYAGTPLMSVEEVAACAAAARSSAFPAGKIFTSGATRMAAPEKELL